MTQNKRILWAAALGGACISLLLARPLAAATEWQPAKGPLSTRWTRDVNPEHAHPEYPRPQLVRSAWQNLNGLWDYAIRPKGEERPGQFDGQILVPFAVESALSGVMKQVGETNRLWYRRSFHIPDAWSHQTILLHFGAVDWEATVYVNGKALGVHRGGYDAFSLDITSALKPAGDQELVVAVFDPSDSGNQPRGKQVRRPGGIFYTPTSGIWQTAWLEPVPATSISELKMVPDIDAGVLKLTVQTRGETAGVTFKATVLDDQEAVSTTQWKTGEAVSLPVPKARLWSPASPYLYHLKVSVLKAGQATDEISSYFGMRKIALGKDDQGRLRLFLNNQALFQLGPLDQGFWPDGLYTAPTDEALRYDIEMTRKLGFNMARKHVKVEPDRWYYWCDKLGLLVWQDMPSANRRGNTQESDLQFETELKQLIVGRFNHPSIVMWVPFNEGWGQYDTERITAWVKSFDPSRIVNNASGWTDKGVGDVNDIHAYPGPGAPKPEASRAGVLGEFGGLGLPVNGHTWQAEKNWGYRSFNNADTLAVAYLGLIKKLCPLIATQGLAAAVYTQTTDVEVEVNGLMTYDRAQVKMDADALTMGNLKVYAPPAEMGRSEPGAWFGAPKELAAQARGGLQTPSREPLRPSPLMKLPIGSITPKGWLRRMLELEAEGMTGHLKEISPWVKFESNAWSNPEGKGHSGWEEMPYWLKGYGDLGYVLKDESIIREARRWIDAALAGQIESGWFGPRELQKSLGGKPDMWPHMVMLNVFQSFYEATGDARVIPFMTRYFRWQNQLPPEYFGAGYWPKIRAGDNIESIYWLYNRTGDAWLLDLAKKIHEHMADWASDVCDWHNVNIAQGFREPGVYFQQANDPQFLAAAERNYQKVMGLYGQFPGGGFAGDENCRPGYDDPRQGFETCGIVEFMHSFEMLGRISGNPVWADRCEEIAFNTFPASMTPDLKGLHYLTGANMIQLDRKNKAPALQNGGNMLSYSPFQAYRCCQHNVSHGWPYYAEELWLGTWDQGLCASLYAASEVRASVAEGAVATIVEETDYPFGDTIRFHLELTKPATFPLYFRIPKWCDTPALKVNGKLVPVAPDPQAYIMVNRRWAAGDAIQLQLPMRVAVRTWKQNHNAVSVDYGPLTFSLKIGEKWQRCGGIDLWPEWEVFPTTPWNYGLALNPRNLTQNIEVVRRTNQWDGLPFTPETAPIELRVKARKIPAWQADRFGLAGLLQDSPVRSTEPEETVTLIPMGAARLRISSFPLIGAGADAREWVAAPQARPLPYKPSASHVHESDTEEALCDGREPANSNDQAIPRFTWWGRLGTREWVQYDFERPRKVSSVSVYWFDDRPGGGCRVPSSWRLLYRDGEDWKPVDATGYGVQRDAYNTVAFPAVETKALRLDVQLQDGFSSGILEWKLKE